MAWEKFEEECPGCRPAIIDPASGRVLPADDPVMVKVNSVWETTSKAEREAFHRVCCQNSRAPEDIRVMQSLSDRMSKAIQEIPS